MKPSFRSLGQRGLGKAAQELKKSMGGAGKRLEVAFEAPRRRGEAMLEGVELARDDVEMTFEPKAGFAAAGDRVGSVVLDTRLDDELRDLGLVRELQYRIQTMRKEARLEYTDRIRVSVLGRRPCAAGGRAGTETRWQPRFSPSRCRRSATPKAPRCVTWMSKAEAVRIGIVRVQGSHGGGGGGRVD